MIAGWVGTMIAGCLSGSFVVPSKKLRVMPWNAAWLIYCAVSQVIGPVTLGLFVGISPFYRVFSQHLGLVVIEILFGLIWGLGAYLFGICVQQLGIAISNAIVVGTVALLGSLSPLLTGLAKLSATSVNFLLVGLVILSAGIAASCRASLARESQSKSTVAFTKPSTGFLLALLSGTLSAMLNIGFVYGQPLTDFCIEEGVNPAYSSLAIWMPVLGGGFLINAFVTISRLINSGEYTAFARSPIGDWIRSVSMGILWLSGILLYGVSSRLLGSAGAVYGWAMVVGSSVLIAIIWGIWFKEWTDAPRLAKKYLYLSLVLILLSLLVLSTGKS